MHVGDSVQKLIRNVLPLYGLKFGVLLYSDAQIRLHELKYRIHMPLLRISLVEQFISVRPVFFLHIGGDCQSCCACLFWLCFVVKVQYGLEFDDAGMVHLQKVVEFAVGAFGVDEILEGVDDLFDGDDSLRFLVAGLVDDAVGALAYFGEVLVVFKDVVFELFGLFHKQQMHFKYCWTQLDLCQLISGVKDRSSASILRLLWVCFCFDIHVIKQFIYIYISINYQMSAAKALSPHNKALFTQLYSLAQEYPLQKDNILQTLLKISADTDSALLKITPELEKIFNLILMTVLKVDLNQTAQTQQSRIGLPESRISSLKQILEVVCRSQENKAIKRSLIITFIQNILECLGVSDLTEVLEVISSQICNFASSLEELDQYKLLRIINHLLKRISKTEDYHIRGQLHFTLTRFLPICHDSGFHYRAVPAKASDHQKIGQGSDQLKDISSEISYEFYEQFWQTQKYFMDSGELVASEPTTTAPSSKINETQPVLLLRLKKIEFTLREVNTYFSAHPAKETSDYYSHPLKFLKNYSLLTLQLADPFFRKVIMLQTLIFTFSLTNQGGKSAMVLGEQERKILLQIEGIATNYLRNCCGDQGKLVFQEMTRLISSEVYWMELKDNWKDRKKQFSKRPQTSPEDDNKQKYADIEKKRVQIRRQINEKMKIEGSNLLKFLENKEPISLQKAPSCTSFSFFYSQALNCLNSFDHENGKQTEFQTRSEYNMFEWKAMRSLYRENIRQIWSNNQKCSPKMKEYRLISLLSRKEDELVQPPPHKQLKQQ